MTDGWDVLIGRDELTRTAYVEHALPTIGAGEVLLKPDRVGVTANNVTYALVGDSMRYWDFFPAEDGWGRVPLWGFADVVASNVIGVEVGARFYGYLPPSSHLVVRPERVDEVGFRDASEHRSALPSPYNIYASTTGDPAYDAEREDLQVLYRPLFITSFMLVDFLDDHDLFDASTVVISSASSKTAYGAAFCLGRLPRRPRVVGLTSAGNVDFTRSLGCYDEVLPYDEVTSLPTDVATVYVDVAGAIPLRRTVHEHLGDSLKHDAVVGATHLDAPPQGGSDVPGPRPTFFFAPDQIRKRRTDWGPRGIEERYGVAWHEFVPSVETWVDVTVSTGPEGLRTAWLEVLSGRVDPRRGHVVQL